MKTLTALTYIGSKSSLMPLINSIVPSRINTFVDVFGGSGVITLNHKPYPCEVYNDINGNLVNLFRVIRDEKDFKKLSSMLDLTLYSREEWQEARRVMGDTSEKDRIKRAWAVFVAFNQSVNGVVLTSDKMSKTTKRGGWAKSSYKGKNASFWAKVDNILRVHERLKSVQVENSHFRDILDFYDRPETLFYLDPPYVSETRAEEKAYQFELYDFEHKELVDLITSCKGKVILSGYDSPLYDRLKSWNRIDIPVTSGARADGVHVKRVEVLWYNYDLPRQKALFEI